MTRWFLRTLRYGILLLALLLAACAGNGAPQPPQIAYGHDMCAQCGMTIDDERFAAALVMQDGKTRVFDDAGEMFLYQAEHSTETIRAWYVHDYTTKAWVNGEKAIYVVSDKVRSPMVTGVAAFVERSAAESFGKEMSGKVLSFEETRTALQAHP